MDDKTLIAERAALELKEGNLVNLGIGQATFTTRCVEPDAFLLSGLLHSVTDFIFNTAR
jgi:acyl CoA:acetate/3-ketoacid CoA transferase beta subunit